MWMIGGSFGHLRGDTPVWHQGRWRRLDDVLEEKSDPEDPLTYVAGKLVPRSKVKDTLDRQLNAWKYAPEERSLPWEDGEG